MRVNARFDEDYAKRMAYLTRATHMGVSEVIKASVLYYYEAVRGQQKPQLTHLSQWIGKASSGRSDVASSYKDLLSESFAQKHGKTKDTKIQPEAGTV